MKIGYSTYAKNHREYQILFGLICTRQLYLVSCHRLHLPTKIQIDNHASPKIQRRKNAGPHQLEAQSDHQ